MGVAGRVQELLRRHTVARFLVAGCANTLFGFVVYGVAILVGAPVWAALLASVVMGIAFNYLTLGGYAFRQLTWANVPRFVLCYVVVYLANLELIAALGRFALEAILAQAILTPPMAVTSYLLMRFVVFTGTRGREA